MATANTRPRFRSDLVDAPLEIEGNRFVDVTDPDSEETFRFYEVEYQIARAMDGQRDVDGLITWAREELGLEPLRDEVQMVIATLGDLGYLSTGEGGAADEIELGSPGSRSGGAAPAAARVAAESVELGAPGASELRGERPAPPAAAAELELGAPGKAAVAPGKVTTGWDSPPVSAAEFEELIGKDSLGAAGGAARPAAPPIATKSRPDSDEDGPTLIPSAVPEYDEEDVSVDLSDHLSIGTEDVAEAVRQSKVMDAVEIPTDLAAALDDEVAKAELPPKPAPLAPADVPAKKPAKVALPKEPAKVEKAAEAKPAAATEAPAEKSGGMGGLLVVVLLLALVAGGAYYYLEIYSKKDAAPAPSKSAVTQATGQSATPKAPPAPASAKLVVAEADAVEVGAVDDGVIAMIAVEGDEVEEGAVVAQLKGVAAVERSLARPRRKLEEYSAELDAAKQGGNERLIKQLEKKVEEKRGLVESGEEKLAKLNMLAPTAGTVEPLVAAGATVAQGDPVVRIAGQPALAATLPVGGKQFEVGGACKLAPKADPAKFTACVVDSLEGSSVTVRVPADVGFSAGDEVVLQ